MSQFACSTLVDRGAWDHATSIAADTLRLLPEVHSSQAAWIHRLGALAHRRGDHGEAGRRYTQSLTINERIGNQAGLAVSYHQLGILAQDRGDYDEAERRYTQSLTIFERLGNLAGMASSYCQLGMLAQARGDYDEAERRYAQSLTINERIGNQAGIATALNQIGRLRIAQKRSIEAIPLQVKALVMRLALGIPAAARDIATLREIEDGVGVAAFREVVESLLDEDAAATVFNLLGRSDGEGGDRVSSSATMIA